MVHRASRDRQSSTRRSWTTARSASKALARAEVRGGAGGSSQTMKPSSESRGHQASTSKSWTTARGAGRARAIAEARGSTNRSSQTIIASRESIKPSNINQWERGDRKHGRLGSDEGGGARQRRRELSKQFSIERAERPPRIDQQELDDSKHGSEALARAERRGSTDGSSRTILPSSGSRGHQASTSKSWTTASMAARLWRAEGRGSADGGSRTMKPSSETRDERSSSNDR